MGNVHNVPANDGVGMRPALGPRLLFHFFHTKIRSDKCKIEFETVFYLRFMEDSFVKFKSKTHLLRLYDKLTVSAYCKLVFFCQILRRVENAWGTFCVSFS